MPPPPVDRVSANTKDQIQLCKGQDSIPAKAFKKESRDSSSAMSASMQADGYDDPPQIASAQASLKYSHSYAKHPLEESRRPRQLPRPPAEGPKTSALQLRIGQMPGSVVASTKDLSDTTITSKIILGTEAEQIQFCQDWDGLQSTKQLKGSLACMVNIKGVNIKGDEAILLFALLPLTAYFQAIHELKQLMITVKDAKTKDTHRQLQEKANLLESNINALYDILQLEGIKEYWSDKNKDELTKLFQDAVGIFWRNATSQEAKIDALPFDILPDEIEPLSFLKQATTQMFNFISAHLTPYLWSESAHFTIGDLSINHKSLPFDMGKSLFPGTINLTTREGRKKFEGYRLFLEDILQRAKPDSLSLEIDATVYNAKQALVFLAEHSVTSYIDMAKRYRFLYESLRLQAEQDDIRYALKTGAIAPPPTKSRQSRLLREEIAALKTELMGLSTVAIFSHCSEAWKTAEPHQDPQTIQQELMELFSQKMPCSLQEKRRAMHTLLFITEQLQSDFERNQGLINEQNDIWKFFEQTCDSQGLNQIFEPKPLGYLDWSFSKADISHPFSHAELQWLQKATFSAVEIVKTERSYWEKIDQFFRFVSDPNFQSKIKDKDDKQFLMFISKKLQNSLRNSETLSKAMGQALGISLTDEDYRNPAITPALQRTIEMVPPIQQKELILKLCNLLTITLFDATIKDASYVLDDALMKKWDIFITKNKKEIDSYWKSIPQETETIRVDVHFANLLYVPFQQRMGRYPLLWNTLRENIPPSFKDAIELTYLRAKTKTEEVARKGHS